MSMPFLVFSCSRCDFTGASTVVWGEFLYAASPEPVALERDLGWCSACAGLAPVEVLPTPDRIDRLRSEIGRHQRRVEAATARARAQQPWLDRLLRREPPLPRHVTEAQRRRKCLLSQLAEEEARLALLKDRRSPARCLKCGSTACELLPPSVHPIGNPEDPGFPVRIEMRHPGCGGELEVAHSGVRIVLELSQRTYDVEGRLVEEAAVE